MLKPLIRGAGEFSPGCHEATRLQSEALDHQLTRRQRIGLRIHLFLCKWCRRYARQLRFLRAAAQGQEEHERVLPPPSLRPEARQRIKERMNAEKGQEMPKGLARSGDP